jgi:hypothetical protein
LSERSTFLIGHAGLIAKRHGFGLHRLRGNCCDVLLDIGNGFQGDIFWRFLETFMRRFRRVAHHAVLLHKRQHFGVINSKRPGKGCGSDENCHRRRTQTHLAGLWHQNG